MLPKEELYGRVEGIKFDIDQLVEEYKSVTKDIPQTPYFDNGVHYGGWAITSEDGSVSDGVKVKRSQTKFRPATIKTPLCKGVFNDVVDEITKKGLAPFRVRILRLTNEGDDMAIHRDPSNPIAPNFRIQIAIITNPDCLFVWRQKGQLTSFHIPADGHAYWVRTDVEHQAVNRSKQPSERVHLLMGIRHKYLDVPKREINYSE